MLSQKKAIVDVADSRSIVRLSNKLIKIQLDESISPWAIIQLYARQLYVSMKKTPPYNWQYNWSRPKELESQ